MHKIVIVDDHPLMRKGLALTLDNEVDLSVVGQMDSAEEALEEIEALDPDCAIIDISLPGMSGMELVKHLQARRPELRTDEAQPRISPELMQHAVQWVESERAG